MKTLFLILSLTLLGACAVTHVRGNDPQIAIDYYVKSKQDIEPQIKELLEQNVGMAGNLTLRWTVNHKGEVLQAEIVNDSLGLSPVNELLLGHLKSLTFPVTPTFMTSTVEYTYKFNR